jgi:hypothetical protein
MRLNGWVRLWIVQMAVWALYLVIPIFQHWRIPNDPTFVVILWFLPPTGLCAATWGIVKTTKWVIRGFAPATRRLKR